jgi:allophanate hydrolase
MTPEHIADLCADIPALARAYAGGALSPATVVSAVVERIETANSANPAWIHVEPRARLLERANALASARDRGANLPLYGIPFAVKDNIDVAGLPTTAGCPAYSYTAQTSATAVTRLLGAGAILIGKTNLDQFATGLSGTRSPYGACHNVYDARYISGGSSSGSAVAVASRCVSFALGTDTAGSGRVPAAFNNLVGLKPTRGLVSTAGVVPACRSLDCVSVFAQSCGDALRVLDVIEGYDAGDSYSRPAMPQPAIRVSGFRFATPRADQLEFFGDTEYARLFELAAHRLESLGGIRLELDFSAFFAAQALLYDGPWIAERTAQLGEFMTTHVDDVHPVTRGIINSGHRYSAAQAFRAQHRLAALRRESEAAWQAADVLLVPGAPTIYALAQMQAEPVALNARLGLYTNFVNLLDLAAITVPAGFRKDGLPFGVTLIGPAFSDRSLAALGARFHAEADDAAIAPGTPASNPEMISVAVVGAHLSGMPLNHELTLRGAHLLRATRTAPHYRLYALESSTPRKPGMVHVEHGETGGHVEVEVWSMPAYQFGSFVAGIPRPLCMGTVALEDGATVHGFLCEGHATAGCRDITALGGWRNYIQSITQKEHHHETT